ncbi:chondroadherin-like protein [Alligator mississippiensis]|uniref:Chondroadherin-like protein n=1 Tax=Alligator mississippiensis TaxID=8496 RepID=A0A151PCC6_ALLMI|nr:chondroadherin-like protein [Alligator mississippiensis]
MPGSPRQGDVGTAAALPCAAGRGAALWARLLLAAGLALGAEEDACDCSAALDYEAFRAAPAPAACCLNFTGSAVGLLAWDTLGQVRGLRELHLAHCGIAAVSGTAAGPPGLEVLRLGHNRLQTLPDGFLADAPRLRVLDLEDNRLQALPGSFLRASAGIQEVSLGFNALTALPAGIFQPSLLRLGLANNSWHCSCALLSGLRRLPRAVSDGASRCHTPERYRGVELWEAPAHELCQAPDLTALAVCLPLLGASLAVAWCICRRRRKAAQGPRECHVTTVAWAPKLPATPTRSQGLPKPSATLPEGDGDLYEEVEMPPALVPGSTSSLWMEPVAEETAGGPEAERLSMSEVLRDSAAREKLYRSQTAEYYSLVPGLELDDSDPPEYESVELG